MQRGCDIHDSLAEIYDIHVLNHFFVDIFTIAVIEIHIKKQNKQKPYRPTGYRRLTLKLFSQN